MARDNGGEEIDPILRGRKLGLVFDRRMEDVNERVDGNGKMDLQQVFGQVQYQKSAGCPRISLQGEMWDARFVFSTGRKHINCSIHLVYRVENIGSNIHVQSFDNSIGYGCKPNNLRLVRLTGGNMGSIRSCLPKCH